MRSRLQRSAVFVATLIVGADTVGVACVYPALIAGKTLANKIVTRDSYGVCRNYMILLQTRSSYGADPHVNHPQGCIS